LSVSNDCVAKVWKISKDAEDIVYALDYNQKSDKHLPGIDIDSISRPHLLITNASTASSEQMQRKQRDSKMIGASC